MSENNLFICVDGDVLDIDTIYRYLRVFRELKILGDPEYGKIVAEINSETPDIILLSKVLSNLTYELRVCTFKGNPYSLLRLLDIKYPNKNIDYIIVKKIDESIRHLRNYSPKFKYTRDISNYLCENRFGEDIILSSAIRCDLPNSFILYLHERNILRKSENK